MPKFSIIIPVKSINDYVRESVPYVQALSAHSWELLIIPNNRETNEWPKDKRISIIDSGRVGPADKRDLGAKKHPEISWCSLTMILTLSQIFLKLQTATLIILMLLQLVVLLLHHLLIAFGKKFLVLYF